jgi:hypothetical protein
MFRLPLQEMHILLHSPLVRTTSKQTATPFYSLAQAAATATANRF